MKILTTRSQTVLFIGDSITDCGWREDPSELGQGYVRLIADLLASGSPQTAPRIVNRGISGNKVTDLEQRWNLDVIAENPDVLSIKIGINDVWHGLGGGDGGVPVGKFRDTYQRLLDSVREKLPECKLVLCEPSVIWPPQPPDANAALAPFVDVVRELAKSYEVTALVPLHEVFEQAAASRPDIVWAPDGVHPSSAGHMLIARAWLTAVGWW